MFRFARDGTFLDYKADRLDELYIPPELFLGRTVAEVLPSDVAAPVMMAIANVLDHGGIDVVEYALDSESGHEFFEARIVAAGQDEVVAIVRNVTKQAQSEATLRAAKEAAERANQLKSAFLSTMSHELRTPLTSIAGYTELLQQQAGLNPELAEDVNHMARSTRHLLALVSDLLDLSRIDAGAMPLRVEPVLVADVIADTLIQLAPQIGSKGLAVEAGAGAPHGSGRPAAAAADSAQCRRERRQIHDGRRHIHSCPGISAERERRNH